MSRDDRLFVPIRDHHEPHAHDVGLAHDLKTLSAMRDRRQALRLLAGASLLPLVGCGTTGTNKDAGTIDAAGGNCAVIPGETAGPYPGNGSNGANALAMSGIVRSDIRTSLPPGSGTAEGVPLIIRLTLVNTSAGCAPLGGQAVYAWQCDREAQYSMYTLTTENYLRGVQETDASGQATFISIFPACYTGRWPHVHFEVYPNLAAATASGTKLKTSQLAFPEDVCNAVYATAGYSQSVANLRGVTLASDGVFRDGVSQQLATVTGSVDAGYVASLTVGISG